MLIHGKVAEGMKNKPLNAKAYGHIPHLPGSRLGPKDHKCHPGQAKICTEKVRDKYDKIIVQEKYDGSCVAVARLNGEIVPLTRSGYLANTSPYKQHAYFWDWAWANRQRFLDILRDDERLCGEWLSQAHGTRYRIEADFPPFRAFDLMTGTRRLIYEEFCDRVNGFFFTPSVVAYCPLEPKEALSRVVNPWCLDEPEGVVYRVERKGEVDFLAKYVRNDKVDGCYLPEISGKEAVWNWKP